LALAQKEFSEFGKLDKVVHVVGPEQASFFKVTFKVEELLDIQKDQQKHLIYGWVKLKHGKMSSRSGNVVLGEWLLDEAKKAILKIVKKGNNSPQPSHFNLRGGEVPSLRLREGQGELRGVSRNEADIQEIAEKAAVAAIKYSFLKVGTLQEIAFDIEESINFNGDSGPYLQYTYARTQSVLTKSKVKTQKSKPGDFSNLELNSEELAVLRHLSHYTDIIAMSVKNYSPNLICNYLYELAQKFNTFYNKHKIIQNSKFKTQNYNSKFKNEKNSRPDNLIGVGDIATNNTEQFRLALTSATGTVLYNGLRLLGIEAPEKM